MAALAFLAMTRQQLGEPERAHATSVHLWEVLNGPQWASDAQAEEFAREAEALILGPPT